MSFLNGQFSNYLSSARIFQPHAITYIIFIILFLVLYFISYVFLTICGEQKCPGFCCCCCAGNMDTVGGTDGGKKLHTFSNDIYQDLSIEDLKNEYAKTKTELQDYMLMIDKAMV